MLMLKMLAPVLLLAISLIRIGLQEKWHDRRTNKHKYVLHFLIALMVVAAFITCAIVWRDDIQSTARQAQIDDLVDEKNELLDKIEGYQQNLTEREETIEQLEQKAKQAAQGITKVYWFNGTVRRPILAR